MSLNLNGVKIPSNTDLLIQVREDMTVIHVRPVDAFGDRKGSLSQAISTEMLRDAAVDPVPLIFMDLLHRTNHLR